MSRVKRGSSVVGAPLRNIVKFIYPTLPVSFGGYVISRSPFYRHGVYARGGKTSLTGVNV